MNYDKDKYELHLAAERQKRGLNLSFKSIVFDPNLHARDLMGKFKEMTNSLKPGEQLTIPGAKKPVAKKDKKGDLEITRGFGPEPQGSVSSFRDGLLESAMSSDPRSFGGGDSFEGEPHTSDLNYWADAKYPGSHVPEVLQDVPAYVRYVEGPKTKEKSGSKSAAPDGGSDGGSGGDKAELYRYPSSDLTQEDVAKAHTVAYSGLGGWDPMEVSRDDWKNPFSEVAGELVNGDVVDAVNKAKANRATTKDGFYSESDIESVAKAFGDADPFGPGWDEASDSYRDTAKAVLLVTDGHDATIDYPGGVTDLGPFKKGKKK